MKTIIKKLEENGYDPNATKYYVGEDPANSNTARTLYDAVNRCRDGYAIGYRHSAGNYCTIVERVGDTWYF
jgi:hypothetical protein